MTGTKFDLLSFWFAEKFFGLVFSRFINAAKNSNQLMNHIHCSQKLSTCISTTGESSLVLTMHTVSQWTIFKAAFRPCFVLSPRKMRCLQPKVSYADSCISYAHRFHGPLRIRGQLKWTYTLQKLGSCLYRLEATLCIFLKFCLS